MKDIKDLYLIAISVALSLLFANYLFGDKGDIAVIDTELLFKELVINTSTSDENLEERLAKAKDRIEEFQQELGRRAAEKNLLIIKKSSSIAGGRDITDQAKALLSEFINKGNYEEE